MYTFLHAYTAVQKTTSIELNTAQPPSERFTAKPLFPYLDVTSLDEVDKTALEHRLKCETEKIRGQFENLSSSVTKTLENSQVSLKEFKDFILVSLDQFTSTDTGVKVLDKADRNSIKAARAISEVLATLKNYTSFFNYHFIEHIIDQFGTDLDQEMLEDYLKAFHEFCKRNVFEIPCDAFSGSTRTTAKVFALKCTDEVATMSDVVAVTNEIAEIFGVPPEALQLCSIKRGCVELHFWISAGVADHIIPSTPLLTAQPSERLESKSSNVGCTE